MSSQSDSESEYYKMITYYYFSDKYKFEYDFIKWLVFDIIIKTEFNLLSL